ncbi:MAG: hypothetical protein Q7U78_04470 [Gallionella sp.]|nr:hypothetical protein [Gallionella sp.]
MEQTIYIIAALLASLLLGAAVIWLVLRERISRAEGDAQVELARLNERLSAAQEDARRQITARADAASILQKLEPSLSHSGLLG